MDELLKQIHENTTGLKTQVGEIDKRVGELSDHRDQVGTLIKELSTRIEVIENAGQAAKEIVDLPGCDETKEDFSFARMLYGIATKNWDEVPFEYDVLKEARTKALAQGIDTAGGFIVPVQYVAQLIELFRSKLVLARLGATMLPGLSGSPVYVPKHTGSATGYWVDENATITDSQQTVGQIELTPRKGAAMTKISNELRLLSNPAIEALVREDLAAVLARLAQSGALFGIGASGQPLGLLNHSGLNSVVMGTNGGAMDFDTIVDIITSVDVDDALEGNLGFLFHPTLRGIIHKLKDLQDRPIFQALTQAASVNASMGLAGYPWATTTQMRTNLSKGSGSNLTEMIFGNWSELLIGMWGSIRIDATQEAGTAFATDQTWIRIIQMMDIGVRHEESFCYVNDISTS